jgi:short-subunit dehydrogenase
MKKPTFTLITGASTGIGFELAKICAREGQNLIIVARSKDKLVSLKKHLETSFGVTVKIIVQDLSEKDAASKLFKTTKDERVDILINNAGFGDFGAFLERDWAKESMMIDLNISTLTHLTKLYGNEMVKRKRGRIMNVASAAGFQPGPYMAVYYATKAYVLHFTEALAEELIGTGVSVTALCPGHTLSDFQVNADMLRSKSLLQATLPTAKEVAEYGYRAMMRGQVVALHGWQTKVLIWLERLVPRWFVRKVIKRLQGPIRL